VGNIEIKEKVFESSKLLPENFQLSFVRNPPPTQICGTKTSLLISAFSYRISKFNSCFMSLPIVGLGIERALNMTNSLVTTQKTDPACYAYLLAALALGLLHCGELKNAKLWYIKMNNALKPCYIEERVEVVYAHVLISWFCLTTSLRNEFKRHCGFARVLIECGDILIPNDLLKAYMLSFFGQQLSSSMMLPGFQAEGIHIFLSQFFVTPEVFFKIFPNLHNFIREMQEEKVSLDAKQCLDLESKDTLAKLFKAGGAVPMTIISFPGKYFPKSCI